MKMSYKQRTIAEIIDSERDMVMSGAKRYGVYYAHAMRFSSLLGTGTIKSIDGDRFLFALFLSQVKKHYTLALFSTLRLHYIQAQMNLRQVLEAGACAAYAIAHTDPTDFADAKADGTLDPSPKLAGKRYAWLDKNFPEGSAGLKRVKAMVNEFGAHANIVTAHQNFETDFKAGHFLTPFFDNEDEFFVKADLWQLANALMGLLDLFYGVNQKLGVIKLQDDWTDRFGGLVKENDKLKAEMMGHDRMKRFRK